MIDPMFGLREMNGKEEIKTKGRGKMWVQVIYFSSNLAHFLFSHASSKQQKRLNFPLFPSSFPQTN